MRVLLDTCVVSEITRARGSKTVKQRVARYSQDGTFLSVVTLGAMLRSVVLLPLGGKREDLHPKILRLESDFAGRLVPIDADTARVWGEISVARQRLGRPLPILDGMIAATAIRHGLHVSTRNVADFEDTGALVLNPLDRA